MQVRDIMTQPVVTTDMDAPLVLVRDLFEQHAFHHLIVTERDRIVGIVSDRDLLRHLSPFIGSATMERKQDENTLNKRVHQIMSRHVIMVHTDAALEEARHLILSNGVSCLPVVNSRQRLVGVITWRDLLPHCFSCDIDEAFADEVFDDEAFDDFDDELYDDAA